MMADVLEKLAEETRRRMGWAWTTPQQQRSILLAAFAEVMRLDAEESAGFVARWHKNSPKADLCATDLRLHLQARADDLSPKEKI